MQDKKLLFEEDIGQYNVFALAAWIKKCRSAIRLNDRMIYQEDYSRFIYDVSEFCSAWEKHRKQYDKVYTDEAYSDALAYLAMQPPEVYAVAGGNRIDITAEIETALLANDYYCNTIQQVARNETRRIQEYAKRLRKIARIEDGRKELHSFMHEIKFNTIRYEVSILKSDGISFDGRPIKEVLPLLKKRKLKMQERVYSGSLDTTFSDFLTSQLKAASIGKNAYYAYVSPEKKVSVTQKNFFTCLAFFLNMDIDTAESFYNQEGYTMLNSRRGDDRIIETCLELGCPLEYANALLVGGGYSKLDNSRRTQMAVCEKKSVIHGDE